VLQKAEQKASLGGGARDRVGQQQHPLLAIQPPPPKRRRRSAIGGGQSARPLESADTPEARVEKRLQRLLVEPPSAGMASSSKPPPSPAGLPAAPLPSGLMKNSSTGSSSKLTFAAQVETVARPRSTEGKERRAARLRATTSTHFKTMLNPNNRDMLRSIEKHRAAEKLQAAQLRELQRELETKARVIDAPIKPDDRTGRGVQGDLEAHDPGGDQGEQVWRVGGRPDARDAALPRPVRAPSSTRFARPLLERPPSLPLAFVPASVLSLPALTYPAAATVGTIHTSSRATES
jgi:hypothetical protein